jgi:2-polyprenyl-6-methoxyphenol hydroxylase-like FAD-dependent oxidoreductase
VIIAGAGPVGLFLACELRLGKLSVRVLEPLEDPHSPLKRLPFGMRGLWGPSIEAFYRRGLLQQIASQPRADDGAPGQPRPGSMASGAQLRGPAGHFAGIQFDYSNSSRGEMVREPRKSRVVVRFRLPFPSRSKYSP